MDDLERMAKVRNPKRSENLRASAIGMALILGWVGPASAQLPGLPGPAKPASASRPAPSEKPIPAKASPGAVFSSPSGPIHSDKEIKDASIQATLQDLRSQ